MLTIHLSDTKVGVPRPFIRVCFISSRILNRHPSNDVDLSLFLSTRVPFVHVPLHPTLFFVTVSLSGDDKQSRSVRLVSVDVTPLPGEMRS